MGVRSPLTPTLSPLRRGERVEGVGGCNTNCGQRVSECRRVELGVAAAPPSGGQAHLLLTLRRPLTYHEEGAEGARHKGVRSPFTPTLSPLEKGERV
jgi:hypothetical protein